MLSRSLLNILSHGTCVKPLYSAKDANKYANEQIIKSNKQKKKKQAKKKINE